MPPLGVTEAMAHFIGTGAWHRCRRRRPEEPTLRDAEVERFATGTGHRVVEPRRQTVLATVAGPGEAEAAFRCHESARRIRHHVGPRQGRQLHPTRGTIDPNDILGAVAGESPAP